MKDQAEVRRHIINLHHRDRGRGHDIRDSADFLEKHIAGLNAEIARLADRVRRFSDEAELAELELASLKTEAQLYRLFYSAAVHGDDEDVARAELAIEAYRKAKES